MKHAVRNLVVALIVTCLWTIQAHSQTQMASLRPGQQLLWHRTSPSLEKPGGPVLYQLVLNGSATPGTVPMFDTNPRHLANSPITIRSGNVVIGGGEGPLVIDGANGLMTFASGQTFPASAFPSLAGEVTGPPGATVVSSAVADNTAIAIVRRDGSGSFSAGSITLGGTLALPNTTSATVGAITLGGTPFVHNFGTQNTFVGTSAGNLTLTGKNNTGVGFGVLSAATTGYENAAFGFNALLANTAGIGNSAFGDSALSSNTTANSNAAFGAAALASNTTGSTNSTFGTGALFHNTTAGGNNAFGFDALLNNTTGEQNAAFGLFALQANTTGMFNTAFGHNALSHNTTANGNAAFGVDTLLNNTTGFSNDAFGVQALGLNTTGRNNQAFGGSALGNLVSGSDNIALGGLAGSQLKGSESSNIDIGNEGMTGDSGVIRIGDSSAQTAAFIAGISGATIASGVQVFVNSSGQLGTATSSQRYKEQVTDLGSESDVLMKLRPVSFYYKPAYDSTHTRQYGLVAEEVARIAPGLVVFDQHGTPQTVRYHFVNAMLLSEVQRQRREIEEQQKHLTDQQQQIDRLRAVLESQQAAQQAQVNELMLRLAAVEKRNDATLTPMPSLTAGADLERPTEQR